MNTPWGPSETEWDKTIAEGIVQVSTPSHGGIAVFGPAADKLSREAKLFPIRLDGKLFFEEDCDRAIVAAEFPEHFPDVDPDKVKESLERWNKEYLRLKAVPA